MNSFANGLHNGLDCTIVTTDHILELETPLAFVGYTSPTLIEVHFKPDVTLSMDGITALMEARRTLGDRRVHCALLIFPKELDFDIPVITTNHHERIPQPNTRAVAWVVHNERNEQFTRMYLTYWAPPFPARTFLEEEEARAWLSSIDVAE